MKAIGFRTSLPISEADAFVEFEAAKPSPKDHELLVKVKAVSVNPVDFKIRQNSARNIVLDQPKVIGWDAVGVVEEAGSASTLFKKDDEVYYAGDLGKPGSNAEYQIVDERIVGKKPARLSIEAAAAMPLTALTAWEILFDRLRLSKERDQNKSMLIIGGAGGVGSVAVQIAKKMLGLKVIATASRKESTEWVKKMGADVVVNHKNLVEEVRSAGHQNVDYIVDFVDVTSYWDAMAELIKPQGHIGSISDNATTIPLGKLKRKSVTFSWELMFTRSIFQTEDMIEQHYLLNKVADLLDQGIIETTLTQTLHGFNVDNFKKAHQQLESGSTIGKVVIKF
ncbi:MAG: zinc-binding alcohol dehydrogenase family protein [Azospira oryzae]|nr:MAG: zinc-binding alcohol dehydrogenase family protein [Azospira oryzae]